MKWISKLHCYCQGKSVKCTLPEISGRVQLHLLSPGKIKCAQKPYVVPLLGSIPSKSTKTPYITEKDPLPVYIIFIFHNFHWQSSCYFINFRVNVIIVNIVIACELYWRTQLICDLKTDIKTIEVYIISKFICI